jgi:hypothetical protein
VDSRCFTVPMEGVLFLPYIRIDIKKEEINGKCEMS